MRRLRYFASKVSWGGRRYFSGEQHELFEEVLQLARERLDDQMFDAGAGVSVDLVDDLVRATVKCGSGLRIINGPADPGLYAKRHLEIFFVAELVHRLDGGTGRFRRQPEAVPSISESRCAFKSALAAASHENPDWDLWSR
jgi:hypothetical protein